MYFEVLLWKETYFGSVGLINLSDKCFEQGG